LTRSDAPQKFPFTIALLHRGTFSQEIPMNWANGYPAETNYRIGFYRNLAPSHLAMICHLQGVQAPGAALTYLELGCGAGLSTTLLAAANPQMNFIGVDLSPSHIVEASSLAAQADVRNVEFIEASFDDPDLIDRLPPCDIISLHGVYTWVSPRQREAIRDILSKRLKPGGLFYIAYNNMVTSSHEIVLQRALRELSRNGTPENLKAAFDKIKQMKSLGAEYFQHNPALARLLDDTDRKDPSYLVHEYLTDHWTPYFFQDLARELADCKLSYLGSATPADNRDEFLAAPDLINLIKTESDPHVRQFLNDISSNRRFRNDIFVRGSRVLEPQERSQALRTTTFALAKPRADIELNVTIARGLLQLRRPMFGAILDHLQNAPSTLAKLNLDDDALVEAITLLSQAAIIHPAKSEPADAAPARRLNRIMFSSEQRRIRYGFAASPRIGSAIPVSPTDRIQLSKVLGIDREMNAEIDVHSTGSGIRPAAEVAVPDPDASNHFWQTLQIST
jgi:SAM-dependent methyltransferase